LAEDRAAEIASLGSPLDEAGISIAQQVGVAQPKQIRTLMVGQLPTPSDPQLQQAAMATGLLGPGMIGLTLGYGVYICHGYSSIRLLSHECRHVHQYEQAGSIAAYLPVYLQQIVDFGYRDSPFEVDARNHELHA